MGFFFLLLEPDEQLNPKKKIFEAIKVCFRFSIVLCCAVLHVVVEWWCYVTLRYVTLRCTVLCFALLSLCFLFVLCCDVRWGVGLRCACLCFDCLLCVCVCVCMFVVLCCVVLCCVVSCRVVTWLDNDVLRCVVVCRNMFKNFGRQSLIFTHIGDPLVTMLCCLSFKGTKN